MTSSTERSTRDRILAAAATMFGEDPAARLSVRAVAARAGVSVGSLRFHFPSQRELHDAVLAGIYAHIAPDDRIRDASLPAHDRLVASLQQIVGLVGVGDAARHAWRPVFETYIAAEPGDDARASYAAMARHGDGRIEHWLGVLAAEGAIGTERIPAATAFLSSLLDGLSLRRALPTDASTLADEAQSLSLAVEAVLGPRG